MANPTGIAAEKYVSLTTYKKDGKPKALPVWISELPDGRVGFTTPSESWKAKRIANDPRVVLQPSNSRGVVTAGSAPLSGTAVLVSGAEYEQVRSLVKAKYGAQFHVMIAMGKVSALFGKSTAGDSAVVISPDAPGSEDAAD
jgi:PPOX class probable F420-dependent enzyme